jgi:hypothetical protein
MASEKEGLLKSLNEKANADFYGVGKRGATFKGSKIVYND